MTELARLSQLLIDEPPAQRASLNDLRSRSHKRHVRHWSLTVSALAIIVVVAFGAVQIPALAFDTDAAISTIGVVLRSGG